MPTKASGWSLYIKTKTLMNCKLITLTILSAFSALTNAADKVTITLTNTLSTPRTEMVETKLADVQRKLNATTNIIITDPNGQEIPSQATHDGKLIFQAGVPAKGKAVYYATKGTPQKYAAKVAGRLFTERQDEFGWENDKVAYRIYGHGGAVGYDLFNKNTSDLMLDYWYASEQNQDMRRVIKDLGKRGYKDLADQVYNAYCYHINHGKGMDCYTVGPTLGGGANALMEANGNLLMPSCYKSYKILDQGPLRFTVELTYPERQLNDAKVIEKRVITLDAGSHFNRVAVTYQGLPKPMTVAAGAVVHKSNPTQYVLNAQSGFIGYEDLGDASVYNAKYRNELAKQMGHIYIGLLFPQKNITTLYKARENGIATGHILGTTTYHPSTSFTYYFGTGWDQNTTTEIHTFEAWQAVLAQAAKAVRTPLKVSVK